MLTRTPQAIAYHELIRIDGDEKRIHEQLIAESVSFASSTLARGAGAGPLFDGVGEAELAVEVMMVKLALRIVPYLSGYSHVQTNTKYSYDTAKTVKNARREFSLPPYPILPCSFLFSCDWLFGSFHYFILHGFAT